MAAKRSIGVLILVMMGTGIVHSADIDTPFLRKNALAVKLGYHFYPTSDFTDFWKVSKQDFDWKFKTLYAPEYRLQREPVLIGFPMLFGEENQSENFPSCGTQGC